MFVNGLFVRPPNVPSWLHLLRIALKKHRSERALGIFVAAGCKEIKGRYLRTLRNTHQRVNRMLRADSIAKSTDESVGAEKVP